MKKILNIFCLFSISSIIFAAGSDGIYLPDLTTEVEDKSEIFVPEIEMKLSAEIEIPEGVFSEEIILPEEKDESVQETPVIISPSNLLAGGYLGLGLPGNFKGGFDIFNSTNDNPFFAGMDYDSMNCYNKQKKSEGFFDNSISIHAGKTLNKDKNTFNFFGSFNNIENGFQNKCSESSFYSRSNISGRFYYNRELSKGFSIATGITGDYYLRSTDKIEDVQYINFYPEINFVWNYKKICILLNGNYDFTYAYENQIHRGNALLSFSWANDSVIFLADTGIVFGNKIGKNTVQVPFKIYTQCSIPVKFSDNRISLSVEGGMSSEKPEMIQNEWKNSYSAFTQIPGEVSDWYGKLEFFLPVKNVFSLDVNFEYRKTAFGNSFYEPDYLSSPLNGLYGFHSVDRQIIKTSEHLNYSKGAFSLSGGWISNFDFIPASETEQLVAVSVSYAVEKFDAYGSVQFPLLALDSTPLFDVEGSIKVNDSLRIAINAEDIVKLFNGKSRITLGQYSVRTGSASLIMKFNY